MLLACWSGMWAPWVAVQVRKVRKHHGPRREEAELPRGPGCILQLQRTAGGKGEPEVGMSMGRSVPCERGSSDPGLGCPWGPMKCHLP